MWNAVCAAIIIPMGRLRSGDAGLYRYLRRSVNDFDGADAFRNRLRANGFTAVRSETVPGWQRNIVHTFLGGGPTMTDPRRASHPAPPGLPDASALARTPHVVVVGAGIAGLAAAAGLVERGVTVDVVEREPYLGGRVGGWTEKAHDGTDLPMNRGFHAFFRQYYNLRDLLRRIDSGLGMLTPVEDYPLVDGQGRRDTFRGLPQTPPLNALAFALRSPTFRLRDLARLNARAAAPLAAVSVPDIYERLDHVDADTFLRDINFPDAARHLAFEVFSRSFFAEPADLSAAELATMFHIYFLGSSEGLIFDVANANFDVALWNPLREYLESRGARFHTGVSVDRGDDRCALSGALRPRCRPRM